MRLAIPKLFVGGCQLELDESSQIALSDGVSQLSSTIGFIVIIVIYVTIGVLALVGTATLSRRFLRPKAEQIFYAAFFIAIAAFYIAFNAYFQTSEAWRTELMAVAVFSLFGVVGVRLPAALVLAYPLHAFRDRILELNAHGAGGHALTAIPLAYGAFCATFDVCAAVYVYLRRKEWSAAWAN